MITKLLDELYWNELKERLIAFRQTVPQYNIRALRYLNESYSFPYSFIFDQMVFSSNRILQKDGAELTDDRIDHIFIMMQEDLELIKNKLILTLIDDAYEVSNGVALFPEASKEGRELFEKLIKENNLEVIFNHLENRYD